MKFIDYGLSFALLSTFLSSIATVLKSGAIAALGPFIVLSITPLIGACVLYFYLLYKGQRVTIHQIKQNRRDLIELISIRQIIGMALFTFGLMWTDPIKAIFFTKVEPYFVMFLYWKYRNEPVKKWHLVLLLIHIIGAILLSTGGKIDQIGKAQIGDFLIIASMMTSAYSYFSAAKLSNKIGAVQTNTIMLAVAGLFFLPIAIIASPLTQLPSSVGWWYLLGDAIIFSVFSLSFWFVSIKTVKAWIVSSLRALGPLIGAPFAYVLFGNTLTITQVFAGALVLATSSLIAMEHSRWVAEQQRRV